MLSSLNMRKIVEQISDQCFFLKCEKKTEICHISYFSSKFLRRSASFFFLSHASLVKYSSRQEVAKRRSRDEGLACPCDEGINLV